MAYGMENTEVRYIRDGKVYKPFTAIQVWCDPCALPNKRYTVTNCYGHEETMAFWELIWDLDNARDRYIKLAMNRAIAQVNQRSQEATHAAWQANTFGNVKI